MPGPAIHHILAREYLQTLKSKYSDPASMTFWNKMDSGEDAPIYQLGSQWPDFLFFNINDWTPVNGVKTIAEAYCDVEDFKAEFEKKVKEMIPAEVWAALGDLEQMASDAVERSATLSLISGLVKDVKNNIELLKTTAETKIKEYVSGSFDLFSVLKHPQQHGQDYPDWWWFDTLHIRRSGRFLTELMVQSKEYSPERAFALGALTHYAADTVGHPFVNALAGGPYRTHSQRHKVVENHQDVWAYSHYNSGAEFITSNLAQKYEINGSSTKLPDTLKNYLISCINKVYYEGGNPVYGKKIDASDLDLSYRCWIRWFSGTTNDRGLPKPTPFSLTTEIIAAWDKFCKNNADIVNLTNSASGQGGIIGLLNMLAALIAGPFLFAGALLDFIIAEIATLGTAPIKYFLSLSYEALYNSYLNFRQGVVLSGFAFPLRAQLNHYAVSHMINSGDKDVYGNNAASLPAANLYPSNKYHGIGAESHLIYPKPIPGNGEKDICTGFPASYLSKDPSWYMTAPRNTFKKTNYNFYRQFNESTLTELSPDSDKSIIGKYLEFAQATQNGGLGSAVAFSNALYAEYRSWGLRKHPIFIDFNLDSDRGYAFKSWRKVEDIRLINSPITNYQRTNVPIEDDKMVPNIYTDIIEPVTDPDKGQVHPAVTLDLDGWVDLHAHPMANLAFGGKLIHGAPDVDALLPADNQGNKNIRAQSMAHALCDDRASHGGWNLISNPNGDTIRAAVIDALQEANNAEITPDEAKGAPNFEDWPHQNDITHQKMWYTWIQRAYEGGLRVMVALAVNNQTLAAGVSGPGDGPIDDKGSGDLQLEEIKTFVARHADFMEVAYSAADLERIVRSNRLGIVLGVELDMFGGFDKHTNPTIAMVENELLRLYVKGVRYIFPIHALDNKLGGTAIYDKAFNISNYREFGEFWQLETADPLDGISFKLEKLPNDTALAAVKVLKLGIDPFAEPDTRPICTLPCQNKNCSPNAIPVAPCEAYINAGRVNCKSLTPLGEVSLKAMMNLGMMIDIDHMSQKSANRALTIAENVQNPMCDYPINSGHNGPRSLAPPPSHENQRTIDQLSRIGKLGGMLGLGIATSTPEFFIKTYGVAGSELQGNKKTDFADLANKDAPGIGLGTDINGMVKGSPKPEKENKAMYDATFSRCFTGNRPPWDYNKEGVVHYGMLPDYLQAVKLNPHNGEIVYESLQKGAEKFIAMWKRCEEQKGKAR